MFDISKLFKAYTEFYDDGYLKDMKKMGALPTRWALTASSGQTPRPGFFTPFTNVSPENMSAKQALKTTGLLCVNLIGTPLISLGLLMITGFDLYKAGTSDEQGDRMENLMAAGYALAGTVVVPVLFALEFVKECVALMTRSIATLFDEAIERKDYFAITIAQTIGIY